MSFSRDLSSCTSHQFSFAQYRGPVAQGPRYPDIADRRHKKLFGYYMNFRGTNSLGPLSRVLGTSTERRGRGRQLPAWMTQG